jgi:hypothetical protein
MKVWGILGLILCWSGAIRAQVPLPAANRLQALGIDVPLGASAFGARSFPQGRQLEIGWLFGASLHHYGEVEGLNARQIAIHRQKSRYHQAFFLDDWGDALHREQHYRLHTGLFLGKWQFGIGIHAARWQIVSQSQTQMNASVGISSRINAQWQVHTALQQLYQPLQQDQSAPPQRAQSIIALHYQQYKYQLLATYRQQLGTGGDFGLGFLYQPREQWQINFAWSTSYRRLSLGMQYQYRKMRLHFGVMYQLLPGPWWNSGFEGGWP